MYNDTRGPVRIINNHCTYNRVKQWRKHVLTDTTFQLEVRQLGLISLYVYRYFTVNIARCFSLGEMANLDASNNTPGVCSKAIVMH